MANPTLDRLRRQARDALAQAAMHRRQGETEEAEAAQAEASFYEQKAKEITDEARERWHRRRRGR